MSTEGVYGDRADAIETQTWGEVRLYLATSPRKKRDVGKTMYVCMNPSVGITSRPS